MNDDPIQVLLVEDNPDDADRVREMLSNARTGRFQIERCERFGTVLERLARGGIDVVLLDLTLPDSQGLETLKRTHTAASHVPIVVLTGLDDDEISPHAIFYGAQDCLVKTRTNAEVLVRAIRYAIQRKRAEENLLGKTAHLQIQQVISAAANEATSIGEALQSGLDLICAYARWPVGHAFLCSENHPERLIGTEVWHLSDPERFTALRRATEAARDQPAAGLVGEALASRGVPTSIEDIASHPSFVRANAAIGCGLKSVCALPVMARNEVVAVLEFFSEASSAPNKALVQNMMYVGSQIARVFERQKMRRMLVDSQKQFEHVLASSPAAIYTMDPQSMRLTWISPNIDQLTGYKAEEALAPNWRLDHIYAEDRETTAAQTKRILGENQMRHEYRFLCKGGLLRWILDEQRLLRNDEGKPVEIIGSLSDITDRRKAIGELDRFFTLSPDLISTLSYGGYLRRVNPSFAGVLGWTTQQLLAEPFMSFVHSDDQAATGAELNNIVAGRDTTIAFENRFRCKDGSYRWLQWHARVVPDEEVVYAIARDVTERKQAEETLKLLGSAVNQSKDSIVITDAELDLPGPRILFVNPAFTTMTGYTSEEVFGKTPRILQGPRTDRAVRRQLRETLARGEVFQGEAINYHKDGTEFHLEWQVTPIRDPNGTVTHFMSIQRDITERKRLEEQFLQAQKNEAIGRLAGGVAHDFNNILTAIMGYGGLMQRRLKPEDPLREHISQVLDAARRAAGLTRQLLAFSRKQVLEPKVLNLNEVVADLSKMLRRVIGEDVELVTVAGQELGRVRADPTQVEQVLMNLAVNARDAMPDGGKLIIETANADFDEQFARLRPEIVPGRYVMLAVSDTGTGMSEEVKGRIFEPFFTTKPVGKGTGLGLATCFGIVKQSGGHIGVYSELGKGTTFKVFLRRVDEEADVVAFHTEPQVLPRGTETILLVEDEASVRELASLILDELGYKILPASNGDEALRIAREWKGRHIDLLVTDVVMPEMGGKELADLLPSIHPGLKVLFASGYTEDVIAHHGVLDPGIAFLQKPYTSTSLARRIRDVLDAGK